MCSRLIQTATNLTKMKYILVTGGVISGVGKGVIASSFGTLLNCCGIDVTSIKIDPYINIDAGTFSPYEHGMYRLMQIYLWLAMTKPKKRNKIKTSCWLIFFISLLLHLWYVLRIFLFISSSLISF